MKNIIRRAAEKSWPLNSGWGNHRALLKVEHPANAVRAKIEWRRRDLEPHKIGVRIMNIATGEEIPSIC